MKELKGRQLKYKKIFLDKVSRGIYVEKENRCPCGASKDILVAKEDKFGIPLTTVLCKACGLLRSDPYYTEGTLRNFYNFEYRALYEPAGKKVTKKFFDRQVGAGEFIYNYLKEHLYKSEITGKTVFEIGTSAGGILKYFQKSGNSVVGCDYDSGYIRYGKKKGLNLMVGGVERLESLGMKADVVILCHVLEHFRNPTPILKRIKKLLKKDGVLFIAVPGIYFVHKSSRGNFEGYLQNAHAYYFTLRSLERLLGASGYEMIHGDESVFGLFQPVKKTIKLHGEDYRKVLNYIARIRKFGFYYYLLYYLYVYLVWCLEKLGFLKPAVHLYHRLLRIMGKRD